MIDDQVDQLLDDLTKPTFVWRFARGMLFSHNTSQMKSATTRMYNARKEVHRIVMEYAERNHDR